MTDADYQARRQQHLRKLNTSNMQGHVYVIEFASGTVKVGLTKNWTKRLARHVKDAEVHGISVAQSWVSPAHVGWSDSERRLIAFCVETFGPPSSGEEYFVGADYAVIVAFAEGMSFSPLTTEMLEDFEAGVVAHRERARARLAGLSSFGPFTPAKASPNAEPSLVTLLSDEQLADFRRQQDRKEWADRVRLRREIRAWELSDQGREWAAQYGFTTSPDLSAPASAGGTR